MRFEILGSVITAGRTLAPKGATRTIVGAGA